MFYTLSDLTHAHAHVTLYHILFATQNTCVDEHHSDRCRHCVHTGRYVGAESKEF